MPTQDDTLGFAGLVASGASPAEAWAKFRHRCSQPAVRAMLDQMRGTEEGRAALEKSRQAWLAKGFPSPWEDPKPVYGPHCSHDDCGWGVCGESGLVEHPCGKPGCPDCGGPASTDPEQWASVPTRVAAMSPGDQARVAAYLDRYPLVRRGPDDHADQRPGQPDDPDDDYYYDSDDEWEDES